MMTAILILCILNFIGIVVIFFTTERALTLVLRKIESVKSYQYNITKAASNNKPVLPPIKDKKDATPGSVYNPYKDVNAVASGETTELFD